MPAAIIGGVIAGAGAIGAAAISSNAASNAASTAQQTAQENNALQQQIYNQNVGYATPFMQRGNAAGNELEGFLGLGGDPAASQAALQTYLNSTGYQFAKNEGMSAVTGDKAAQGLLGSGSTLESLDAFGTGLANQYGQQYVGNLENLNASGQAAQGSLAGIGENYANAVSNNNNNAATVSANAALGQRQRRWQRAQRRWANLASIAARTASMAAGAAPAAATPFPRRGEAEPMADGMNVDFGLLRPPADPVTTYANAFAVGQSLAKSAAQQNAFGQAPGAGGSGEWLAALAPDQRAAFARRAEILGAMGNGLAAYPYEQRGAILAHLAPSLIAAGMPGASVRGFDPTDAALARVAASTEALRQWANG